MKKLFETIQDALSDVDRLAATYYDLNQLRAVEDGAEDILDYPCALVGFSVEEWRDLGGNAQEGTVTIRVTFADFDLTADTPYDLPTSLLSLREEVHRALQGLKMADTDSVSATVLSRISEEPLDEVTNLPAWVMVYTCEMEDHTACKGGQGMLIKQLDVEAQ